jgi:hypothetical protein
MTKPRLKINRSKVIVEGIDTGLYFIIASLYRPILPGDHAKGIRGVSIEERFLLPPTLTSTEALTYFCNLSPNPLMERAPSNEHFVHNCDRNRDRYPITNLE